MTEQQKSWRDAPEAWLAGIERAKPKWADRCAMYTDLVPKGGIGVEIGVQLGKNAENLLKLTQPKKLVLVDKWSTFEMTKEDRKFQRRLAARNERFYQSVLAKFAKEIKGGQVEVQRRTSEEACHLYGHTDFDWLYIDGDHRFPGVLMDLWSWTPRLKVGGLLMMHDYDIRVAYGDVIEAIHYFLKRFPGKFELIACTEEFHEVPSVALRKVADHSFYA